MRAVDLNSTRSDSPGLQELGGDRDAGRALQPCRDERVGADRHDRTDQSEEDGHRVPDVHAVIDGAGDEQSDSRAEDREHHAGCRVQARTAA